MEKVVEDLDIGGDTKLLSENCLIVFEQKLEEKNFIPLKYGVYIFIFKKEEHPIRKECQSWCEFVELYYQLLGNGYKPFNEEETNLPEWFIYSKSPFKYQFTIAN